MGTARSGYHFSTGIWFDAQWSIKLTCDAAAIRRRISGRTQGIGVQTLTEAASLPPWSNGRAGRPRISKAKEGRGCKGREEETVIRTKSPPE